MKKFLLGTTALFGAAALFGADAEAGAPKVTLGGKVKSIVGVTSDDVVDRKQTRDNSVYTDTEINISIDGKSDAGLGYGAVIDLEADVTDNSRDEGSNASRSYLYLESSWGRLEAGSNQAPSSTMKIDAGTIASATGGVSGDFREFINQAGVSGNLVIARPDLPLAYGLGGGNALNATNIFGQQTADNANKVTYYTPKYMGFQAGASYVPSAASRGQTIDFNKAGGVGVGLNKASNIYDVGVSYDNQFDQVSIAASFTGQYGSVAHHNQNNADDLSAYAAGASLGFAGFELAGSYGDWGNSFNTSVNEEGKFWTVGGAYDFGPFSTSVTYLTSEVGTSARQSNEFDNLVIGADYKLAPGLVPFAEVAFFDLKDEEDNTNNNEGHVLLLGTELTF